MASYRDQAIVLRNYKLAEADKIVVLFCLARGKVRAVAKGVRRTKSKFGARLEPGAFISVQLHEGRNLDIVTQAERVETYVDIRNDIDAYAKAAIFLESVDRCCQEQEANPAMFTLLVGALRELNRKNTSVLVPAFIAKLLALEGVQPLVSHCASCGSKGPLVAFQLYEGGALCSNCRRGSAISQQALAALELIFSGQVRAVLETTAGPVARELETLASQMIEQHIERKLTSSAVYSQMS